MSQPKRISIVNGWPSTTSRGTSISNRPNSSPWMSSTALSVTSRVWTSLPSATTVIGGIVYSPFSSGCTAIVHVKLRETVLRPLKSDIDSL